MDVVVFRRFILAVLLFSSFLLPVSAADVSTSYANTSHANTSHANFIQQRALDPIKLQTGLPEAASRLHTPSELQISLVHNNVFMGGVADSERLVLDGESSQLNLRYRRKINACWQVNVSGAWLAHSQGWFDQPVDDFHQFFGLPDAQRGEWPSNELDYSYETRDGEQTLRGETYGWGDAQFQLQHYLGCTSDAPVVRVGLKLPIGAHEQFLGNGSVDMFADIQSTWKKLRPSSRWQWAASVGVLKIGKNEFMAESKPLVGFGVAGLNYTLNSRVQVLGQLDWHTPMFDSGLRELGKPGAQVSMGVRYQTKARGAWEFSFSEDVAIDTFPDIVVRIGWVSRFDTQTLLE